jgi:hypothetical protein
VAPARDLIDSQRTAPDAGRRLDTKAHERLVSVPSGLRASSVQRFEEGVVRGKRLAELNLRRGDGLEHCQARSFARGR